MHRLFFLLGITFITSTLFLNAFSDEPAITSTAHEHQSSNQRDTENRPKPLLFDLDIDSDNNDGFQAPKGSDWEEHIEEHSFSLGKLIEVGSPQFVPVRITIPADMVESPNGEPDLDNLLLQFDVEDAQGEIQLWNHPERTVRGEANMKEPATVKHLKKTYALGVGHLLSTLNYNPQDHTCVVWIEGKKSAPGLESKEHIDRDGRPDMFLRARLLNKESQILGEDKVKYLPVEAGSFFTRYVTPDYRHMRNYFAALFANGTAGEMGSINGAEKPLESRVFCIKIVPHEELKEITKKGNLSKSQTELMLDTVSYTLRHHITRLHSGIPDFRPVYYRDYNSGDYTLAFRAFQKDRFRELNPFQEPGLTLTFGNAFIHNRRIAGWFGLIHESPEFGVMLPGLEYAGYSVAGDLAVSAALSGGGHADTFNTLPVHKLLYEVAFSRQVRNTNKRFERSPGFYNRLNNCTKYVHSHSVQHAPFLIQEGPMAITFLPRERPPK